MSQSNKSMSDDERRALGESLQDYEDRAAAAQARAAQAYTGRQVEQSCPQLLDGFPDGNAAGKKLADERVSIVGLVFTIFLIVFHVRPVVPALQNIKWYTSTCWP